MRVNVEKGSYSHVVTAAGFLDRRVDSVKSSDNPLYNPSFHVMFHLLFHLILEH